MSPLTRPAISRASLGSATESSEDIESQDSTSRISRHSTLTARPVSSSTCLVTEPSERRVIFHAGESEGESDSDTAPQGRGGCCRVFSVEDGEDDEVVLVVVDDHTRSSFDRAPRMRSSGFGDVGGKAAPPEAPLRGEAVACARHGRLRRGGDVVGTPRLGRRETSCPRCTVMKGARLKGGRLLSFALWELAGRFLAVAERSDLKIGKMGMLVKSLDPREGPRPTSFTRDFHPVLD